MYIMYIMHPLASDRAKNVYQVRNAPTVAKARSRKSPAPGEILYVCVDLAEPELEVDQLTVQ